MSEETAIRSRRGKWSQPGVPHTGWVCTGIEDIGDADMTCEMCESTQIRFVHSMEHEAYGETLRVGCVCAGHMEQDRARAERRERTVRSRAAKRQRWLTRKWRESAKGNEWLRADGYRIVVRSSGPAWTVTVAAEESEYVRHSKRRFATPDAAKLAAFDFISALLVERP